jgi:hypothetical protein
MTQRQSHSLKYEYEQYVEREIEAYKESVQRKVLMSIADEAVRVLEAQAQFTLTEFVLWAEVDKIIFKRQRLASYKVWQRQRVKLIAEQRRPEHWGLSHDDLVVRAVQPVASDARVLVAGAQMQTPALYLAANGCDVTALSEPDAVQRVLDAAEHAGLGARVHASAAALE